MFEQDKPMIKKQNVKQIRASERQKAECLVNNQPPKDKILSAEFFKQQIQPTKFHHENSANEFYKEDLLNKLKECYHKYSQIYDLRDKRKKQDPYLITRTKNPFTNKKAVNIAALCTAIPELIQRNNKQPLFTFVTIHDDGSFTEGISWVCALQAFIAQGYNLFNQAQFNKKDFIKEASQFEIVNIQSEDSFNFESVQNSFEQMKKKTLDNWKNTACLVFTNYKYQKPEEAINDIFDLEDYNVIKDKQILQIYVAFKLLSHGGNFVMKIKGAPLLYQIGIFYFLYQYFQKIYIFKPFSISVSSFVSFINQNQFVVCIGFKGGVNSQNELELFQELEKICKIQDESYLEQQQHIAQYYTQLIDLKYLVSDKEFYQYSSNQIFKILGNIYKNQLEVIQENQDVQYNKDDARNRCLQYWGVMDANALAEEQRKIRGDLVSQQKEEEFFRKKRKGEQSANQIKDYGAMNYIFTQNKKPKNKTTINNLNKEQSKLSDKSKSREDLLKILDIEDVNKPVKGFDWKNNDTKIKLSFGHKGPKVEDDEYN